MGESKPNLITSLACTAKNIHVYRICNMYHRLFQGLFDNNAQQLFYFRLAIAVLLLSISNEWSVACRQNEHKKQQPAESSWYIGLTKIRYDVHTKPVSQMERMGSYPVQFISVKLVKRCKWCWCTKGGKHYEPSNTLWRWVLTTNTSKPSTNVCII